MVFPTEPGPPPGEAPPPQPATVPEPYPQPDEATPPQPARIPEPLDARVHCGSSLSPSIPQLLGPDRLACRESGGSHAPQSIPQYERETLSIGV